METQPIKITGRMLPNIDWITIVRADVNGHIAGKERYPNQRAEIYHIDPWQKYGNKSMKGVPRMLVKYNYRTGTSGDTAYSTGQLADKLNKAMDTMDKKGIGYEIHIEGDKHDVFSNVYLVGNVLKIGKRIKRKGNWYLSTPTY